MKHWHHEISLGSCLLSRCWTGNDMITLILKYTDSWARPRDLGQNDRSKTWTAVFSQSSLGDCDLQPDLGNTH